MTKKKCRKCGKDLISGTYNYTAGICDECILETEKIKNPIEVIFNTKDGDRVSFKATKIERKKKMKNNKNFKDRIKNILNDSNNSFVVRGFGKSKNPITDSKYDCYKIISRSDKLRKMEKEGRFEFSDFILINPEFKNKIIREFSKFIEELKKELIICYGMSWSAICPSCKNKIEIINKLSGFEEENE